MTKIPNIDPTDDDFGAVLNCAIRYSLGRQTYMPHLVMDFARPLLPFISSRTLWCMARDIREAETYGGYGSPVIDEPHWRRFLADVENEVDKRERRNLADCSTELKKDCSVQCNSCICRNCDKRFNCDGGNPLFGCGE